MSSPPNPGDVDPPADADLSPHAVFCRKLGIEHYKVKPGSWWNRNPREVQAEDFDGAAPYTVIKGGYYYQIECAYTYHSWQYWITATTIILLYLSQVVIGATATALGGAGLASTATTARTTAITILTAIGTVVAGSLAFLKSRGQPNRVRQLRNNLREVLDYIRAMKMAFAHPADLTTSVDDALKEVKALYDNARKNAEINYPDTWSTVQRTPATETTPLRPGTHVVGGLGVAA